LSGSIRPTTLASRIAVNAARQITARTTTGRRMNVTGSPIALGIQHQGEVGCLDAADERSVAYRLKPARPLVDERIHIVESPIAVALDAEAVSQALVLPSPLEEVERPGVDGLEDVELHRQLGDRLRVALRLDQLVDLGFEVGYFLLVVVHRHDPRDKSTGAERPAPEAPRICAASVAGRLRR